jgi:hypothetical protein
MGGLTKYWRKLCIEELHYVYSSPNITGLLWLNQKERERRGIKRIWEAGKCMQNIGRNI